MHVLFIPSWYPQDEDDFTGSFFREQAIAICNEGVELGVIAPMLRPLRRPAGKFGIEYHCDRGVETYRSHGVLTLPLRRPMHLRLRQWRSHGRGLYRRYVARHGKPEIIHAHSMISAGLVARDIASEQGIPYVVTEHSSGFARGLYDRWQLQTVPSIAAHASARFAVSQSLARQISTIAGDHSGPWRVMPNMVDEVFLKSPLKEVSAKPFIWLNICAQNENKRVDLLIGAFARAFPNDENVQLHLGGDGEKHEALQKLANELGIASRVRFLGRLHREQVIEHMMASHALVLCSRLETFGVVAIESLALGRPVIATRCGGPEDVVTNQDGLLVPVDDERALADAMRKLHAHRNDYCADRIREHCRSRFSPSVLARRHIDVYGEVLLSG